MTRLGLVACVLTVAACSASGRGSADLGVSAPRACPSYPSGAVTLIRSTGMTAQFTKSSDAQCTSMTMGSCAASILGPRPNAPAIASAGTLSVTGGAMPLMQSPDGSGAYPIVRVSSPLWAGGESLSVSASGGEVPPFATTLIAPGEMTVTSPAWPAGGPTTIARADDLALAWNGSGVGVVDVGLVGGSTATQAAEIHCRFPLSAGQGVVPAAMLANLPAGSSGALLIFAMTPTTLTEGAWSVDVSLESAAVDSHGASVSYSVTYP